MVNKIRIAHIGNMNFSKMAAAYAQKKCQLAMFLDDDELERVSEWCIEVAHRSEATLLELLSREYKHIQRNGFDTSRYEL